MSRLLIIITFSLCIIPTFGQSKITPKCQLKESPSFRGFFLGQTVEEIDNLIPSFKVAYEREKRSKMGSDEVGWIFMSSSDFFYRETGGTEVVRKVPSEEFEDTDFIWHFLDDKLIFLSVQYTKFKAPNLKGFINQITEKTDLPKEGWVFKNKNQAILRCSGFQVDVSNVQNYRAGSIDKPSVMISDTIAEVELERRRKENQDRRKTEERERIQLERKKKTIFKP